MKKLLVFAMFVGSIAHASRMDDILIMTSESIEETLGLIGNSQAYEIVSQDFAQAAPYRDLAIKTELVVMGARYSAQKWTCVTQFVKTPKFFEVSETDCK